MNADQTPFRAGWWSFDLGKYRACNGTYCFFPYESIPPLDQGLFRGEFQWLAELDAAHRTQQEIYDQDDTPHEQLAPRLEQLRAHAGQLGLSLPESFLKFMRSGALQDQIPSCTACYFKLGDQIVKSPAGDKGFFLRFLNDQQDCILWYLYLTPAGGHCVVASPMALDEPDELPDSAEVIAQHIVYCAPTFEEFIYRFWLENTIWFALNEGGNLTEAQKLYLARVVTLLPPSNNPRE